MSQSQTVAPGRRWVRNEAGPDRLEVEDVDEEYAGRDGPFDGPFFDDIAERKENGRDAVILVTADDADRGVGKTACAVTLGELLDTSDEGFDAEKKATLSVPRFLDLYDELEQGSSLILDEGEQLDSRRSMSQENVDASHKIQTRRVNEVILIITLPSPDMIDKRIEQLADYWVNVECRGKARVYKKKIHRIKRAVYYQTLQTVSWPNLDGYESYEKLASLKDEYIEEDGEMSKWVRETEVQDRIQSAVSEAEQEKRNELITAIVGHEDILAKHVAEAIDLSPARVSQIAREEV